MIWKAPTNVPFAWTLHANSENRFGGAEDMPVHGVVDVPLAKPVPEIPITEFHTPELGDKTIRGTTLN